MLTTLDVYVLKKLVRTYVPVLLGLGALFFVGSLLRTLRAEQLSAGQVLKVLPWLVPFLLPYLVPIAYAITVALTLGRLVADQEVLALVSLGVPQRSVAWPAVALAVPLSLASLWVGGSVVPYSYQRTKEAVRAVFESLLALGDGEHLSRVFDDEGFDIYVRRYGPEGLRGIVIHFDLADATRPDSTLPAQIVAERGHLAAESRSERIVLTLEDVTATVQAQGEARHTARPTRAHLARYDQGIGLSQRRRIKPGDYATPDLRAAADRADARAALAAATGGLVATRAAGDRRGADARIELAMRAAVALAPLVLALLVAPLTLLVGGRSPLVPLVIGLVAAVGMFFAPTLLGRSLAETRDAPALVFLGVGVGLLAAVGVAWAAGRGAPGSGGDLVSRPRAALERLGERLAAWRARRRAPRPSPAGAAGPGAMAVPPGQGPARPPAPARLGLVPLLDRWLAARFVRAWLALAAVILLVFVVIDAFTNLESIVKAGLWRGVRDRYGLALPELFLSASPFVTLLAALWVVVQLRRSNELVSLVSAGIAPRRLLVPFLAVAALLAPLVWADRELLLPAVAWLRRERRGRQAWERPRPIPDLDGGVLAPRFHDTGTGELRDVRYARLDAQDRERLTVLAAVARPADDGWRFERGWMVERQEGPGGALVDVVAPIASEGWLLRTRTSRADVEAAVDAPAYLSARQLRDQLRRTPGFKHLAVQLHERATYPLSVLVLLLVSLPIALGGGPGAVDAFVRVLACVGLSAAYFLSTSLCYELGARELLPPAVAAWAPVVVFGGAALVGLARAR